MNKDYPSWPGIMRGLCIIFRWFWTLRTQKKQHHGNWRIGIFTFQLKTLPESGPATNAGNFDDLAPKLLRRCLRFLPLRFCSVQEHKSRGGCVLPPIESPRDHIPTPTNIFIDLFDFRRSVSKIQGTFFKKWMVGETTIAGCNPNHLSWENSHETWGTQQ